MKTMLLADIHESEEHWSRLVEAVAVEKPELVIVAGDLLPKYDGIQAQLAKLPLIRERAGDISRMGAELIITAGNDDNQLALPALRQGETDLLWHDVTARSKPLRGYEFCGAPWVRDYPFPYKYWVAAESEADPGLNPLQLGPPALLDRENEISLIKDWPAFLAGRPAIGQYLSQIAERVNNMASSIWLIHNPPSGLGMDRCGSGDYVGSPAVRGFLARNQPFLAIHGHIHEAPEQPGGRWYAFLGATLCLQPGQGLRRLHYVTCQLKGTLLGELRHSIFGPARGRLSWNLKDQ